LIIAFSEMGLVEEALWVYRKIGGLPQMQACNALLNGLVKLGRFDSMWKIYWEMLSRGMVPNVVTYGVLVDNWCRQGHFSKARELVNEMVERGIEPTVVIYTTLINCLCSESKMIEAEEMFRSMRKSGVIPNLYTYNCLIEGHCKMGDVKRVLDLYQRMLGEGLLPNVVTFGILIDALRRVGELRAARNVFVYMAKFGVVPNIIVYNCLIDGHCKAGNLSEAMDLHLEMKRFEIFPDVFTYSILIKGLCGVGKVEEANDLLLKMRKEGVLANSVTYNALIDGYCKEGNMKKALEVCSQMMEKSIQPNVITFSSLIDGFCKAGNIQAATGLFEEMVIRGLVPDVVTYTALIDGHCKDGNIDKALRMHKEMIEANLSIDSFSFLFVLKCCTQKRPASLEGKQLHTLVIRFGCEPIIQLQTSLIIMYASMGNLSDAHRMFDEIPSKNIICWTALVSAYVDNQRPYEALQLFRQMQMDNVEPDRVTLTVALSACAHIGGLKMGEWIHDYIRRKQDGNVDSSLYNTLINMYAKCGDIETARRLFDSKRNKDVTTWTTMIVGYALHGQAQEALQLFAEMKELNKNMMKRKRNGDHGSCLILPNEVTFIGVLMACSHAGMVEEGKLHFESMSKDYELKPRDAHFGCMVDLLCRAGLVKEANDFITQMPTQPNEVVWRTLLGACRLHGNVEIAGVVRGRLVELGASHVGDYIAMSNIYAAKGMWEKKIKVRDEIKQRRDPGCSWIEVGSGICEFVAADTHHPMKTHIYEVLNHL
ncbi:PPR domain-containing protein/PPR_1 domain-containing protein/PPR_2 domain-containing protein, partial [Cephalotus follicularis]